MNMTMQELSSLLLLLSIAGVAAERSSRNHESDSLPYGWNARGLLDNSVVLNYPETVYMTDENREMSDRQGPVVSSGVSNEQRRQLLAETNEYRRKEGASDMELMTWSSKLADLAQRWADRCQWGHGQVDFDANYIGYKILGQNNWAHEDATKTLHNVVTDWFDEKKMYDFGNPGSNDVNKIGHYSQLVWAKTREMGCGITNCSTISFMKFSLFVVCNYGPIGNDMDQNMRLTKHPYKKGDACASCGTGKFFCTNGLCDPNCIYAGSSSCVCKAKCGNCGHQNNDCTCKCKPGWYGPNCNEECRNTHEHCTSNPGWPDSWCSTDKNVLDKCPKKCKTCVAAEGDTCRLREVDEFGLGHDVGEEDDAAVVGVDSRDDGDDDSQEAEKFQQELSEFVEKMQGHLHHRHADPTEQERAMDPEDDRLARILARVDELRGKP